MDKLHNIEKCSLNAEDAALLRDFSSEIVAKEYRLASYSYEVIMERIKEFEGELDDEHEVAINLAAFGTNVTMSVTEIGYSNPSTLIFYGFVGGQRATLVQHMSQLNFLLLAAKKSDPEKPPRRIVGFADSNGSDVWRQP